MVIPFSVLIAAHAKLLGAGLHTAAHHQTVPRFKDVQRTGHSRVGHRADENRDVLGETIPKTKTRALRIEHGHRLYIIQQQGEGMTHTWRAQPSPPHGLVFFQPTETGKAGSGSL